MLSSANAILGRTRPTTVSTALLAVGTLLMGACGDDSGDGDAASGDHTEFCADADGVLATAQGTFDDVAGDDVDALEGVRDMYLQMRDLQPPEELASDWELFFGSSVDYFESFLSLYDEEGMLDAWQDAEIAPEVAAELDEAVATELDEGESATAEQEDQLAVMDDPEVMGAETAVSEFLQDNCDLTI